MTTSFGLPSHTLSSFTASGLATSPFVDSQRPYKRRRLSSSTSTLTSDHYTSEHIHSISATHALQAEAEERAPGQTRTFRAASPARQSGTGTDQSPLREAAKPHAPPARLKHDGRRNWPGVDDPPRLGAATLLPMIGSALNVPPELAIGCTEGQPRPPLAPGATPPIGKTAAALGDPSSFPPRRRRAVAPFEGPSNTTSPADEPAARGYLSFDTDVSPTQRNNPSDSPSLSNSERAEPPSNSQDRSFSPTPLAASLATRMPSKAIAGARGCPRSTSEKLYWRPVCEPQHSSELRETASTEARVEDDAAPADREGLYAPDVLENTIPQGFQREEPPLPDESAAFADEWDACRLDHRDLADRQGEAAAADRAVLIRRLEASLSAYLDRRDLHHPHSHRAAFRAIAEVLLDVALEPPSLFLRYMAAVAVKPGQWPLEHDKSADIVLQSWLKLLRNTDARLRYLQQRILGGRRLTLDGMLATEALTASDMIWRAEEATMRKRRTTFEAEVVTYLGVVIDLSPALVRSWHGHTVLSLLVAGKAGNRDLLERWANAQEEEPVPLAYWLALANASSTLRSRAAARRALEEIFIWQRERGGDAVVVGPRPGGRGHIAEMRLVRFIGQSSASALLTLAAYEVRTASMPASQTFTYITAAASVLPEHVYREVLRHFAVGYLDLVATARFNGKLYTEPVSVRQLYRDYLAGRDSQGDGEVTVQVLRRYASLALDPSRTPTIAFADLKSAADLLRDAMSAAHQYGQGAMLVQSVADFILDCLVAAGQPSRYERKGGSDESRAIVDLAYDLYRQLIDPIYTDAPLARRLVVNHLVLCLAQWGRPNAALALAKSWVLKVNATDSAITSRSVVNDVLRDALGGRLLDIEERQWTHAHARRLAVAASLFAHCGIAPRQIFSEWAQTAAAQDRAPRLRRENAAALRTLRLRPAVPFVKAYDRPRFERRRPDDEEGEVDPIVCVVGQAPERNVSVPRVYGRWV